VLVPVTLTLTGPLSETGLDMSVSVSLRQVTAVLHALVDEPYGDPTARRCTCFALLTNS
jgi:hypothetical protein